MKKPGQHDKAVQLGLRAVRAFGSDDVKAGMKLLTEMRRLGVAVSEPYVAAIDACARKGDAQQIDILLHEATKAGLSAGMLAFLQGKRAVALGDQALAWAELRRAYALLPEDPLVLRELAVVTGKHGDYRTSVELFRKLVAQPAAHSRDFSNLARALASLRDYAAAEQAIAQALRLDPSALHAYHVAAWSRQQAGQLAQAEAALIEARRIAPRDPLTLGLSGSVAHQDQRYDDALSWLSLALEVDGRNPQNWRSLAGTLVERDDIEAARAAFIQSVRLGGPVTDRLQAALLMPAIPQSVAEIERVRQDFLPQLEQLTSQGLRIAEPLAEVQVLPFYLAYHGHCNRVLHEGLATHYRAWCPALVRTAPHCEDYRGPAGRIRVGFASAFFFDHSIGRTTRGFIEQLDRRRFIVVVIFLGEPAEDEMARHFARAADEHIVITQANLRDAQDRLAALKLDVLFYQDIGMEPVSYFLAHARLAPVQCYSFGHPDTTGIPTMDWFVSSALFEPAGAAAHYSERLHLLPDVGTLAWYHQPPVVAPLDRASLGVGSDQHFYFCAQSLFKLHPDFDALLEGILAADAKAVIGLVHSSRPGFAGRLGQRLRAHLGPLADRILILPRVSTQDFLRLLATADVLLDTTHFNGMNTSLQGFAQGRPVVTLPGALQRGRHTAAMYQRMGMADVVATDAEDYVRRAVAFGKDADSREHFKARVLAASERLFHDDAVITGFEDFFEMAVQEAISAG